MAAGWRPLGGHVMEGAADAGRGGEAETSLGRSSSLPALRAQQRCSSLPALRAQHLSSLPSRRSSDEPGGG